MFYILALNPLITGGIAFALNLNESFRNSIDLLKPKLFVQCRYLSKFRPQAKL